MISRRTLLASTAAGLIGPLSHRPARAQSVPAGGRDYWNDWPAYIAARVNEARQQRKAALAGVRDESQARSRMESIQTRLWDLIGGRLEKTPLNPRVVGTIDRGQYRIEKVIFESQPQFFVTANLYVPAGRPPFPGIITPLGHAGNGKAYRSYQHLFQMLARQGYMVLAYDPIGQGERQYYLDPRTGMSKYGPTGEHDQAGRPLLLLGSSIARYRVWDGIRAVDYLLSRPEVDAERVGCTGHSGGGTLTMYLCALEPRLRAAVEVEGNSENFAGPRFDAPGPYADAEQNVIGGLAVGIDRGDLLAAFAPKPLLLCYSPVDVGTTYTATYEIGTHEILDELKALYTTFGAAERVNLFATTLPHDYDLFLRRAACNWFNRWLGNKPEIADVPAFDESPETDLNCTSTGQVVTSIGGRSVVQVNTDLLRAVSPKTPPTSSRVQDSLRKLLALPTDRTPLNARTLSHASQPGLVIEEIEFQSEPGVRIPGWFLKPERGDRFPVLVHVAENGKDELVEETSPLEQIAAKGFALLLVDLRGIGIGTPRPPTAGPLFFGGEPLEVPYAWAGLTLGKPVLGQRVWDFLRALDYAESRADVDRSRIHALGVGAAGMVALFGAALDSRVRSVMLDHTLASLRSVVESEEYSLKLPWYVVGLLREMDLPDVARALGSRSCWIRNATGPNGQPLNESALRERYGNAANLRFIGEPDSRRPGTLLAWLGQA